MQDPPGAAAPQPTETRAVGGVPIVSHGWHCFGLCFLVGITNTQITNQRARFRQRQIRIAAWRTKLVGWETRLERVFAGILVLLLSAQKHGERHELRHELRDGLRFPSFLCGVYRISVVSEKIPLGSLACWFASQLVSQSLLSSVDLSLSVSLYLLLALYSCQISLTDWV